MILDRFGARRAMKAIGVVLIGLGSLSIGIEPACAQGAPPIRRPLSEPQGRSPTEEELARAYDPAVVPRVAERGSVELTVVDDETSRAIADADVRISNQVDFRTHVFRTGPRGRLRLEYPSLHGKPLLSVEVRKDGYVPVGQGWGFEGSPGPPESCTFRLRRGTTMGGIVVAEAERLRGRVVDPAGHPIEGARVYGEMLLVTTPLPFHGWTNEDGQFEWADAPAEAVNFRFAAPGYIDDDRAHPLTASDGVAEITLRPAVDVQIVAIDAQTREAIPRFRIQIGTHDSGTNDWRWGPRMGRSPPKGFQILLEAERGPYQFQISADGYLPARILVPSERTVMRGVIPLDKAAR